jgi:hypothetical protein
VTQHICGRLKKKQGIWRVDGIGKILPTKKLGSRLLVHFSQINSKYIEDSAATKASTGETYSLQVSPAWLRLFTPGSLWEEGTKIAHPKTINAPITIDTNHCIYGSASNQLISLETLLPKSHINFGDNYDDLANAEFALVPKNQSTPWLIIPTAELFRYYFGSSTRLISKAFSGSIDKIIGAKSGLSDGELTIYDIPGDLTKLEAGQFGRTYTSSDASEAFYGTHKQIALAYATSSNKDTLYIKSRFPFKGQTTLHVAGKKIPLTNRNTLKKEWAIFVMQIKNCSYPVGIHSIHFIRAAVINKRGTGNTATKRFIPIPSKTDLAWPTEINDQPADPSLGRILNYNPIPSFEPFNNIEIRQTFVPKDQFDGVPRKISTPITGHTFNDGNSDAKGSGNLGIDEVDVTISDIDQDIQTFLVMLQHLRSKTINQWEIKTLPFSEKDIKLNNEYVIFLPSPGNKYSWYQIISDTKNSSERPRTAVWTQIKTKEKYIYLVEMELRGDETGRSTLVIKEKNPRTDEPQLTKQIFKELLILAGVKHGWPSPYDRWKHKKHSKMANSFFENFYIDQIQFPESSCFYQPNEENYDNTNPKKIDPEKWAFCIQSEIIAYHLQHWL